MGTRHLICVFWKGKWVIAQYGQFDGYPEGQGVKIFKFLSVAHNIERLKAGLDRVYYPTKEELNAIFHEIEEWEMNRWNEGVNRVYGENPVQKRYPTLLRDTSARILGIIAGTPETPEDGAEDGAEDGEEEPKRIPVELQLEFANDTLFCEWAYVIDLDQEVFEVYGGGERKHDGHRFKDVGKPYARVPAFVCSFTFSEIYLMKSPKEFLHRVSKALPGQEDDEASDEETKVQEEAADVVADDATSDKETEVQEVGRGA